MSSARVAPIRLLLVDDHEVVRVGLRTLLQNNQGITVVGETGSKAAAVRVVTRLNPDIVLMDARFPDGSCAEATREIRARRPTTRIIFLTSYADDDSALGGRAGRCTGLCSQELRLRPANSVDS
ncbi:MAG: response regulator transcription factor [Nitrospirota bacterium]